MKLSEILADKKKKRIITVAGMIIIILATASVFSYEARTIKVGGEELEGAPPSPLEEEITVQGYSAENTQNITIVKINGTVTWFEVVLTWNDEPPKFQAGWTNQPDKFQVIVTTPEKESKSGEAENEVGKPGEINLNFSVTERGIEPFPAGDWEIVVKCIECGDQEGVIRSEPDNGNAWTLKIFYKYRGI